MFRSLRRMLMRKCGRMYPAKLQDATSIWSYAQSHTVVALARSSEDIPAIRQGIAKRVKDINAVQTEVLMDIMEQPDEIVTHVNHVWANVGPDLRMLYIQYALALLIVLLVPSLNLCGLSNSRMQQRISELGVRKAFGATRGVLIRQILNENLVLDPDWRSGGGWCSVIWPCTACVRGCSPIIRTPALPASST